MSYVYDLRKQNLGDLIFAQECSPCCCWYTLISRQQEVDCRVGQLPNMLNLRET